MRKHVPFYIAILSFCVSSPLCADILLDNVMTKEEQKKTGITSLSFQQKVALEAWLNKNCIMKAETLEAPKKGGLSMSININNGQKLMLSDNSLWEVNPNDIDVASVWITPFPIQMSPSNDPQYPMLLTNTLTGVSVRARKSSENAENPPSPTAPVPPTLPTPAQ
ncbi:MAG: hypothetical protein V4492_07550 [Chlamydiota bacterium]